MGLFNFAKKELYINMLVSTYKLYYNCGDMAAIMCMRKNYTAKELKGIYKNIKKTVGGKSVSLLQIEILAPFKEAISEVLKVDNKYGGK
jgi:hypothetical protein